jgi:hypothetical protein
VTDQEINRAVAEARGWDVDWQDPATGRWYGEMPGASIEDDRMPIDDVCGDEYALGPFYLWLAAQGLNPELAAVGDKHRARVGKRMRGICPLEPTPGRALALAFLKAVQP